MKIDVLVMAGGKGERLKTLGEKPLLRLHGKPMIQYVVEALMKTRNVGRIIVVTSRYTRKTADAVKRLQVEVLEAPGRGYVADVQYAVRRLGLKGPVMVVSADLPLLSPTLLGRVIDRFKRCSKPALSVMIPRELCERLGLTPDLTLQVEGSLLVPAGINILEGEMIDKEEIEEEKMVLNVEEAAVNVNTTSDLKVAERLLSLRQSS